MKRDITNDLVAKVKKGNEPYDRKRPYDINDRVLKGFTLRVEKLGLYWWFKYRRPSDGKQTRHKLGDHPAMKAKQARADAAEARTNVARGIDPADKKNTPGMPTLQEFVEGEYSQHVRAHQKTGDTTLRTLLRVYAPILKKRLDQVDVRAVERIRTHQMDEGRKPRSINRYHDMIKACMAKALAWGIIDANPLAGMKSLKVDNRKKPRFLSEDDLTRLVATLHAREDRRRKARENRNNINKDKLPVFDGQFTDYLMPMVLLALATGARRGEMMLTEWRDFDLTEGSESLTLRAETTKNGEEHRIDLNSLAVETIKAWGGQTLRRGLVFRNPRTGKAYKDVSGSFNKVIKEAGIESFSWHKLRSTFASHQLRIGGAPLTVKGMLDHRSLQTTEQYLGTTPAHIREDVNKMSEFYDNIIDFRAVGQ